RDGDGGAEHIEPLLEKSPPVTIAHRLVEVCVKRADHRTIRFFDRENGQYRRERRVHVDDVVAALAQDATHVAPEVPAQRDARLRPVAIDGLASAQTDDVRLRLGTRNVRGDDVDMMSAT